MLLKRNQCTEADEQYLRAEFDAADNDKNGVLDVDELNELLGKMGYVIDVTREEACLGWQIKQVAKAPMRVFSCFLSSWYSQ